MNHLVNYNSCYFYSSKIDNHIIDLEYKLNDIIKIWIQYNNNNDITYILYNLEDKKFYANNIKNLLTNRQIFMLYKLMKKFTDEILKDIYNNTYRNKFTLSEQELDIWDRTVRRFTIKEDPSVLEVI